MHFLSQTFAPNSFFFSYKYLGRSARCARRDACAVARYAKCPRPVPDINQNWNVLTPASHIMNNRSALFEFGRFYLYIDRQTDRQTRQFFFNAPRISYELMGRAGGGTLMQSGVQNCSAQGYFGLGSQLRGLLV